MSRTIRLGLWLMFAVALGLSLTAIRVDGDLTRFVSTDRPSVSIDLAAGVQRSAGRLVLISVQAPDPRAAAEESRRLVGELRRSTMFSSVHNGDAGLLLEEANVLIPFRYHLSRGVDASTFSEAHLKSRLEEAAGMLSDAREWLIGQLLPRDPTLESLRMLQQWGSGTSLPMRQGVWFSKSGDRALVLATTRAAGDDAMGQQAVERSLLGLVDDVQRRDASVRIEFTGLGLLAAEARRHTRERVERLAAISTALVILILAVSYRRARPVVLSLLPMLLGLAAGVVVTQLVFGDIHLLALGFAGVLVDEGADYAAYLFTQSRRDEPIGSEARRIWPTMRLAVLTSASAFAVLLFAQFRGLQQLAVLCAVGLVVAGAAVRWLLPDLLDPRRRVTWGPPGVAARLVANRPRLRVHRSLLLNVGALAAAGMVMFVARPLWDDGVAAINPVARARLETDRTLRLAAGLPLEPAVMMFAGPDSESVLQAQEAWLPNLARRRDQGAVESFEMAALYLPSRKVQLERIAALPEEPELRRRVEQATRGSPFDPGAFEPFHADVRQARGTVLSPESLPEGLLRQRIESLLLQVNGHAVGLVTLIGSPGREELLASARGAVAGGSVKVAWFDTRAELSALLAAVRARLVALLLVCTLVVFGVVLLDLKSVAVSAHVMLPVATALALTAVIVRLVFGPLTVFNLVALMLALGVLTNYSLFIHAPPTADNETQRRAHTVFSLAVASTTTLAVFGALAISGIVVVESIGRTVVVGIIVGLGWLILTRARSGTQPPN